MFSNYSGEDFDVAQAIALRLTTRDRAAGRPAPAFGYSDANARLALEAVQQATDAREAWRIATGVDVACKGCGRVHAAELRGAALSAHRVALWNAGGAR